MEHDSAVSKDGAAPAAATWVGTDGLILSEGEAEKRFHIQNKPMYKMETELQMQKTNVWLPG